MLPQSQTMMTKILPSQPTILMTTLLTLLAGALWYVLDGAGPWPLLLFVPIVALNWRNKRLGLPLVVGVVLLLWLLSSASGLWAAYDRVLAIPKFWRLVGATAIFYGFVSLDDEEAPWFFVLLMALFSAALAVYFTLTHDWDAFGTKFAPIEAVGRALQQPIPTINLHRLHPNVAGGLIAAALPFSVVLARWSPLKRVGWVCSGLALFGLILTISRGAWLAAAAAGGMAVLWVVLGRFEMARFRPIIIPTLALGGPLLIFLLAIFASDSSQSLVETLIGPQDRLKLYKDSYVLAHDTLFTGAGLGNFTMLHASYTFLTHVGYSVHAHNLLLDMTIEQGIFGVVALVSLWLIGVDGALTAEKAGRFKPQHGAALAAILIVGLHGFVDDAFYGSRAVLVLFFPLVPLVPLLGRGAAPSSNWVGWRTVGAFWAVLLVLGLVQMRSVRARWVTNQAAVTQAKQELSIYQWPDNVIQDAVRLQVDSVAVADQYRAALAIAPDVAAQRRLGQIELSLGNYAAGVALLQAAYDAQPWHDGTRQMLGEGLIATDSAETTRQLWDKSIDPNGQLNAREFWYQFIGEEAISAEIEAIQSSFE